MIEKLPTPWRMLLASLLLGEDIGKLITRLNAIHSRCQQLETTAKTSTQYAERLGEQCRTCKTGIVTDDAIRPLRRHHYDTHLNLPDKTALEREFIQTVRTYFRGRYEQMKSEPGFSTISNFMPRSVNIPYTVTQFQLEHSIITISMLHSFVSILRRYFRRSIQLIGYVGENRFAVIDIGRAPPRQQNTIIKRIQSAMKETDDLRNVAILFGSSNDYAISLSLSARSVQRENWVNTVNDLQAAMQDAYSDMTTATT